MSEYSPQGERLARLEIQVQGLASDMAFIKGAVYLFGILILVAIGAGFKDVAGWIAGVLKP